ncbi:hypothetical protein D3C76_712940 [compost metagenome]
MAVGVVDFLEAVKIDVQQGHASTVLPSRFQRDLETVTQQFAVRQLGQLVVLGHALQARVQLLALDRGGDLRANVLQQLLVLLGVALAARHALDDQGTNGAVLRVQRHAQPAGRKLSGHQRLEPQRRIALFRGEQDRQAAADDLRAQACGEGAGLFRLRLVVADVIGKLQLRTLLVIQRHGKIQRRQPFTDDLVDTLEQRQQVLRRMGRFGNGIQRRLPGFGLLALGNVAGHGDAQLIDLGPTRRPQDIDHTAILAQVAVLEIQLGLAAHDFPRGVEGALTIGRVHQVDHGLADQLVGAVAENALASRADKNEATLFVDRTNGVQQEVDVARQRSGVSGGDVPGGHCAVSMSGHCSQMKTFPDRSGARAPTVQPMRPFDQRQALFVTSPGSACAKALMAKPINITPHNRVMANSWR